MSYMSIPLASDPVPLQDEVSRILHSEVPFQLASQLKSMHTYESRVEAELRAKSEQISKLHNYLRQEITNIQAIVAERDSLAKENESLRSALALRAQQQEEVNRELQMLTQLNREANNSIRLL